VFICVYRDRSRPHGRWFRWHGPTVTGSSNTA